jgi:hypothetical protein
MGNRKSKQLDSINDILLMFLPKVLTDICASYLIIWNFQKQIYIKDCKGFIPINDLLFLSGTKYNKDASISSFGKKLVTSFSTEKIVGEIETKDKIYSNQFDGCDAKWCSNGKELFLIPNHNSSISKVIDYKLVDYGHYNIDNDTIFMMTMTKQDIMFMESNKCIYKYNIRTNETIKVISNIGVDLLFSDDNNLYVIYAPPPCEFSYLITYDQKNMKKINECKTNLTFYYLSNAILIDKFIYVCDSNYKHIECVNVQTGITYDVDIIGDYIATDGTKLYVRNGDIVSLYTKN